jgi:hypothetical protein
MRSSTKANSVAQSDQPERTRDELEYVLTLTGMFAATAGFHG